MAARFPSKKSVKPTPLPCPRLALKQTYCPGVSACDAVRAAAARIPHRRTTAVSRRPFEVQGKPCAAYERRPYAASNVVDPASTRRVGRRFAAAARARFATLRPTRSRCVACRPFEAQGMPWSGGIREETSLPPRVQSTTPITDAMEVGSHHTRFHRTDYAWHYR